MERASNRSADRGKLITFLENVVGHASAVTILAISVERYRVACRTQTPSAANGHIIARASLLIWLFSVLAAVPVAFISCVSWVEMKDGSRRPVCKTPITETWHKVYIVVTTSVFYILPLVVIILLYTKVCLKLMSLFRVEQEKLQSYPCEVVKLKRQMIQIILTVVLVFFLCHTPYRALAIWSMFEEQGRMEEFSLEAFLSLLYLSRILLYANHAINPFVYNFVSRKFRQRLRWVCCSRRQRVRKLHPRSSFQRRQCQTEQDGAPGYPCLALRVRPCAAAGPPGAGIALREREVMLEFHRGHRNDFLVLYEKLVLLDCRQPSSGDLEETAADQDVVAQTSM